MSNVQTNLISPAQPESRNILNALKEAIFAAFHHRAIDARSLPDDLRRDIGLLPNDASIDREINLANVNLRAGIIFPRPC